MISQEEETKYLFTESIFNVVEYLSQNEMSDTAKKLVKHYFNQSPASTSLEKAVFAITRYLQSDIPDESERSNILNSLLSEMAHYSKEFDLS